MPGYFIDVSGPRPEEGEFSAPSDALVVAYDSSEGRIKGVLTIGGIVERTGRHAASGAVYDVVGDLLDEGAALPPGEPVADQSQLGAFDVPDPGTAEVVPFRVGVVVVTRDGVGVLPTVREWGPSHEVSGRRNMVEEALSAMGSLPGFPVTSPGSRWYACSNGHGHFVPVGSEGSPCPSCGEPLFQEA